MLVLDKCKNDVPRSLKVNELPITTGLGEVETGTMVITGAGVIEVKNTGGSSASEGGMGSGSKDDSGKGNLSKPGEKSGNARSDDEDPDTSFDPVKKSVKEAERKADKD